MVTGALKMSVPYIENIKNSIEIILSFFFLNEIFISEIIKLKKSNIFKINYYILKTQF